MVKMKKGAIIKEVNYGSMRWYKEAGWIRVTDNKEKKHKTNTKKTTTTQG